MGALKLAYYENELPLKVLYSKALDGENVVQRFLSVDPLASKLPSWSPYAAFADNPVNVIDEDGRWPTWIHNRIIKMAFKDIMTADQIKVLQQASKYTDTKPGSQTPAFSPEHYMSSPGQSKEEAGKLSEAAIYQKKEEFKSKEGNDALFSLGEGMHTVMDQTSPAHTGSQVWEGTDWKHPSTILKAIGHVVKELNVFRVDDDKVKEAAKNIREYYDKATQEKNQDNTFTPPSTPEGENKGGN